MHTDTSNRVVGEVLVQEGHPVAYESWKLKEAEQKYSAHEKEMLAVIHCLQVWRVYLLGTKFVEKTDNVANTYFSTQKKLSPRQARWPKFLQEYDFEWQHKSGKHNRVADALSRREVITEYLAALSQVESDLADKIRKTAEADTQYQKLVHDVKEGVVRRYWLEDGLLHAKGARLYVPKGGNLRRVLLKETHDTCWAGHPGRERMKALLSRHYYWPGMDDDIEAYVKSCYVCQMDKPERAREAGLLQPLPNPERPWASISMDFISGFPKVQDMASVLVVVDRFTKYAIFIPTPATCTAEKTARARAKARAEGREAAGDIRRRNEPKGEKESEVNWFYYVLIRGNQ